MIIPDAISIKRLARLHPALREEARTIADGIWAKGINMRVVYTLRTYSEQNALYNIGRSTPGQIVTNAKAGQSYHNYGLALDFCIIEGGKASWKIAKDFNEDGNSDWMQVVDAFEASGWEWGGRWKSIKDYPHLQKTFGRKTSELIARSSNGLITYPLLT